MAPVYKVAVIQLYPKPMNPAFNFQKAVTFLRAAAAQGAHLAVLPEDHLTNFLPHDPKFRALCSDWKQYLVKYQALAKELNMCIVPGTIIQTPDDDENNTVSCPPTPQELGPLSHPAGWPHARGRPSSTGLSNVAYFISNDGSITGSYSKKNLWGAAERGLLTSSNRAPHPVFSTPLGKVGLLICWDLAFPEAFRELIAQGAKMIIIPAYWTSTDCTEEELKLNPGAEALFVDTTLTARTFENTCAIVFANAGGPPGKGYLGLSQVVMPFLGPIARLGGCAEGMSVVDVDMGIVEESERSYNVRGDMASNEWHYDYRHNSDDGNKSKL